MYLELVFDETGTSFDKRKYVFILLTLCCIVKNFIFFENYFIKSVHRVMKNIGRRINEYFSDKYYVFCDFGMLSNCLLSNDRVQKFCKLERSNPNCGCYSY